MLGCQCIVTLLMQSPSQRQYQRLIEMLVMMHISPADAAALRAFRLQVKERLYRFNYVRTRFAIGSRERVAV